MLLNNELYFTGGICLSWHTENSARKHKIGLVSNRDKINKFAVGPDRN